MLHTQWPAIKFGYEILGQPLGALAREHDVSITQIEYAIEEEGWKQLPLKDPLAEATEISQDVISNVTDRLDKLRSMKNAALAPQYIVLETEILQKARQLLQSVHADQPDAVVKIKTLTDILGNLKSQNGENLKDNGGKQEAVTVRILSSSRGGDGSETRSAIEVNTAKAVQLREGV